MLQSKTSPEALDALIASLGAASGSSASSPEVLAFLDDCCARFTKVPIKYFDDLDLFCKRNERPSSDPPHISPLLMTVVEQWPFRASDSTTSAAAEPIAQWISRLLYLLKLIGEDEDLLIPVRDTLVEAAKKEHKGLLQDSFLWKMGKERAKEALKLATGADFSGSDRSTTSPVPRPQSANSNKVRAEVNLEAPPVEDERHTGLTRWKKKELTEAIEDGDIGNLLLCLCSTHQEIRLQAINNIQQLMTRMKVNASNDHHLSTAPPAESGNNSGVEYDWQQLYLLFGEILETVDLTGEDAFPYVGGVLAARCVTVLADPTLSLFSAINRFLTASPAWDMHSLLRYFWHRIVASEPDDDGTYHQQVDWYLDFLLDSLRTPADMELFRRSNIFEQLLSHYSSRSCTVPAKEKIIKLLLRATHVGGSTTLVTRCGLIAWIQMMLDGHDPRHRILRTLASRVYETYDQDKVAQWSSGIAREQIAALTNV